METNPAPPRSTICGPHYGTFPEACSLGLMSFSAPFPAEVDIAIYVWITRWGASYA